MEEIRLRGQSNCAFADKLYILTARDRDIIIGLFTQVILQTISKTPGKYELCEDITFSQADISRMAMINEKLGGLDFQASRDRIHLDDTDDDDDDFPAQTLLRQVLAALLDNSQRDGERYILDFTMSVSRASYEKLLSLLASAGGDVTRELVGR